MKIPFFLPIYLLSSVLTLLAAGQNPKAALVYTDVKIDDLLALHVLRSIHRYDSIVIVITGVEDIVTAHRVISTFLSNTPVKPGVKQPEVEVLYGQTPFAEPAPHEANWKKIGALFSVEDARQYDIQSLEASLQGRTVDIFQIAPVTRPDSAILLDQPHSFYISLYHATLGYNTRGYDVQGRFLGEQEQAEFATSLEARLAHSNPEGSKLRYVVATDASASTWQGTDGGTQLMKDLEAHIPPQFLNFALWDPFPQRQFEAVARYMEHFGDVRAEEVRAVPALWRKAFNDQDLQSTLINEGYAADRPMDAIQYSRSHYDNKDDLAWRLREQYLKRSQDIVLPFLRAHIQYTFEGEGGSASQEETSISRLIVRFEKGIVPMFGENTEIEAYDANHILAVLHAIDNHSLRRFELESIHDETSGRVRAAQIKEVQIGGHGYKITPREKGWAQGKLPQLFGSVTDITSSSMSHFHLKRRSWRWQSIGSKWYGGSR